MFDERLKEFATPRQLEYLEAIERNHGNVKAASIEMGLSTGTLGNALTQLREKAAVQGHSPEHDMQHTVPHPYLVKGVSTYYGDDGKPRAQWVKSALDPDKYRDLMRELWEVWATDLPKIAPTPMPKVSAERLLNLYTFSDYHLGMLAWHAEGGADWDLTIATTMLRRCFAMMIDRSPPAKKCIVNIQGDFLHTDGLLPVTPAHKNILDADTRFRKLVKAAVQVLRELVAMALAKHEEVELLICEGNHDEASSLWLQVVFENAYLNEPRLKVHDQALPFYCIQHGKTFIGFHHGHKVKNEQLPELFAAQFRKEWGATERAYIHTGHRHHLDMKEYAGCYVIQHPTLAARDAHAARGGWYSERAALSITYHVDYGKWDERWCTPEMVDDMGDYYG